MQDTDVRQIIERAHDPQTTATKELVEEWGQKSPDEQIAACRKVLYGAVTPNLNLPDETIQQVEALFESTFGNFERLSLETRAGTSSMP